jgi:hypothetical protein
MKNYDNEPYSSQTVIGASLGLSAIQLGKMLTELGLKSKFGPTKIAIDQKYAVIIKNRRYTNIIWNTKKVKSIISQTYAHLATEEHWIDYITNCIKKTSKNNDHPCYISLQYFYFDVPNNLHIKYKPEFAYKLKESSLSETIEYFTSFANKEHLKLFKDMIAKYYPEYINKLKYYMVFQ